MMKNFIKLFVCLFLISTLSNTNVFAKVSINRFVSIKLATPPPTVLTPVYYCQNSVATALTATPSGGGVLNWYTVPVLGVGSAVAPTPITTTVGSTTYYVSQTIATVESIRVPIVVNVVADNGATILNFRCDPTQILAVDKYSSVFFDWSNNPLISNSYNYSYTIQGGSPVTGTTGTSHLQVFGMLPGQSATLTLTSATHPCVPARVMTCTVPCLTLTTPTFNAIPTSYCLNEVPPVLPTTSTNVPAITGTWNPAVINTAVAGTNNYVFTPDSALFPCATTKTLTITVGPVTPDFADLTMCSGTTAPILNTTSPNGIVGTWSPATIDNTTSGSYVFTPTAGQACSPTIKTIAVTVNQSNAIVSLNWTVTEAFAKNQIVTVTDPVGANYTYQLDDGPFQANPIFEYVAAGTHSITVKHIDGCSVFTNNNVVVINYPKYFTPNNDGFNDTWNIITLADQNTSRIVIFDRFGKFLKEIRPGGNGWDGTYTGQPMPANDYWFTVEYVEQSVAKKFNSHFSLKR